MNRTYSMPGVPEVKPTISTDDRETLKQDVLTSFYRTLMTEWGLLAMFASTLFGLLLAFIVAGSQSDGELLAAFILMLPFGGLGVVMIAPLYFGLLLVVWALISAGGYHLRKHWR